MISLKGGLFLLFLVFSLSSLVLKCKGKYPEPPKCLYEECAPYEVIHSEKDYEIRSYKDAHWMSAPPMVSDSYQSATYARFMILLVYYLGVNHDNVDLSMTAPVIVDVRKPPSDGPGTSYTLSLIVPQKHQSNIPRPYGQIEAVKLPQHKYCAVRRFVGAITDDNIPTEIAALRKTLKGTLYERADSVQNFSLLVYDFPFLYNESVNEAVLWFD